VLDFETNIAIYGSISQLSIGVNSYRPGSGFARQRYAARKAIFEGKLTGRKGENSKVHTFNTKGSEEGKEGTIGNREESNRDIEARRKKGELDGGKAGSFGKKSINGGGRLREVGRRLVSRREGIIGPNPSN